MEKRSAASAARDHWAKRAKIGGSEAKTGILDTEKEQIESVEKKTGGSKTSPFRLLYCPSNTSKDGNNDTVRLGDLLGDPEMIETYQFNFSVDIQLVLDYLHPNFITNLRPLTFITGSNILDPATKKMYPFLSEVVARLPDRYGSHHTKMMINFFHDSMEVIVMTANFTKMDFGGYTQMCWRSQRLPKGSSTHKKGLQFQKDLGDYLLKYKDTKLTSLSGRLKTYNFDTIDVDLVTSAPGQYSLDDLKDDSEIYGYGKLYQVLKRTKNLSTTKHHNILAQVSSIASPLSSTKTQVSSIFTHLLCPVIAGDLKVLPPGEQSTKSHQQLFNYKPHIIYPSIQDMINNDLGFRSSEMLHYNYTTTADGQNQYKLLKPYFHRWNNGQDISGRETTLPHVKMFMCDNGDDWKSLKWVLLTSHNLSKQAWGYGSGQWRDIHYYKVASYEVGVLISGDLTPVYKSDGSEGNVRLPFALPPTKYHKLEQPFSILKNYGDLKDRFGQTWHGLDEI
ncbi:tyrosyl-DNA phosphodiesterase 1 [[Candida] jaroonii]|uniref:Tyrosyl-DNA phosphodiesterase 1 n=1 Tax=[Candida] jaroonii TaxID=467808 RepID=A0ACA9YDV2_9ASCO|nr:tyrosyl-DNA phosphodiesterase 1 [[Candida] jaroonii]